MVKVYIEPLLQDPRSFPWDLMGWGVPRVGEVHMYLCRFLVKYVPAAEQSFFKGKPAWRELKGFGKRNGGLSESIMIYCTQIYDYPKSERASIEDEVLYFLKRYQPFKKDFQIMIDRKYREGLISIPKRCRPSKE